MRRHAFGSEAGSGDDSDAQLERCYVDGGPGERVIQRRSSGGTPHLQQPAYGHLGLCSAAGSCKLCEFGATKLLAPRDGAKGHQHDPLLFAVACNIALLMPDVELDLVDLGHLEACSLQAGELRRPEVRDTDR